jgi:hypothetical protein
MVKHLEVFMEPKEFKQYQNISFWKEENDIVSFKYSPNLEITLSIAVELVKNRLEYTNGKSKFVLVDVNNIKSTTKEAREYMSDVNGGLKGILGGAFVSSNMLTTVIINLFLKINKPSVPARFFTDREDALIWLKRIKLAKTIL